MSCAACGNRKVDRRSTFMVDRLKLSGEFYICEGCWTDGANDEAWNERITERIVARNSKANAPLAIDQ